MAKHFELTAQSGKTTRPSRRGSRNGFWMRKRPPRVRVGAVDSNAPKIYTHFLEINISIQCMYRILGEEFEGRFASRGKVMYSF